MYMAERGGFPTRLSYESALDFTSHPQFCSCHNHGGERGIRTPDTLRYTRFPSVRTRPLCESSAEEAIRTDEATCSRPTRPALAPQRGPPVELARPLVRRHRVNLPRAGRQQG